MDSALATRIDVWARTVAYTDGVACPNDIFTHAVAMLYRRDQRQFPSFIQWCRLGRVPRARAALLAYEQQQQQQQPSSVIDDTVAAADTASTQEPATAAAADQDTWLSLLCRPPSIRDGVDVPLVRGAEFEGTDAPTRQRRDSMVGDDDDTDAVDCASAVSPAGHATSAAATAPIFDELSLCALARILIDLEYARPLRAPLSLAADVRAMPQWPGDDDDDVVVNDGVLASTPKTCRATADTIVQRLGEWRESDVKRAAPWSPRTRQAMRHFVSKLEEGTY